MAFGIQSYPYKVTVPPAGDPLFVSLADARAYMRLDATDPTDAELTAFIQAAQACVERFTKLTLFTTEFLTKRDYFECEIELRKAPLIAVSLVQRQVEDVQTTIASTVYKAIDDGELNYGSIVLKANQVWPTDMDRERRTIEITFTAGFGATSDDLPPDLIQGALRVLSDLYENRGDCSCDCTGALSSMSAEARAILSKFRIISI